MFQSFPPRKQASPNNSNIVLLQWMTGFKGWALSWDKSRLESSSSSNSPTTLLKNPNGNTIKPTYDGLRCDDKYPKME